MGGGGGDHGHAHGDFRNKVWSMTGGPYCRPKHWKRNTAIAMVGVVLICIPIAIKSAELEVEKLEWNKALFWAGIVCIGVVLQSLHYSERVPCKINLGKMGSCVSLCC